MKDIPKLRRKIDCHRRILERLTARLDGKKLDFESDYVLRDDQLFSLAMELSRDAGEIVQNMATGWRKELQSKRVNP